MARPLARARAPHRRRGVPARRPLAGVLGRSRARDFARDALGAFASVRHRRRRGVVARAPPPGVGDGGGAPKKESKRKGKGGKGGGGAKGGGKDPDADGEWFGERDAARSLRVSAGVWRALYPDVGEGQGPGENFLGERLLNWLYRDAHAYRERGSLGAESEEAKTRAVASADALLERNEALIAEALRTKATIRAMVDEILVLYGRVASPKAWRPGGLDPERPADVASFEARWRDWHALRRATTRLRARLYELDVAECEVELEDLERCEREWKETVRTIEARRKEVGHEAEAAKKKAAAASKGGKSAADRAAAALAARLEAMVEELEARHQMYMRRVGDSAHEHQCVSRAVRYRGAALKALREAMATERREGAEDADVARETRRWRENVARGEGAIPAKTSHLSDRIAKLPATLAPPLAFAQERLAAIDVQMEAAHLERLEALADIAEETRGDRYAAVHGLIVACVASRLERAAEEDAREKALREQERLLAEVDEAEEAKRTREEKAKARKAEVRARAKEQRDRARRRRLPRAAEAESTRRDEETRAVREDAARREAEAEARSAASAAHEAELARRRSQLEREAELARDSDERAMEAARAPPPRTKRRGEEGPRRRRADASGRRRTRADARRSGRGRRGRRRRRNDATTKRRKE